MGLWVICQHNDRGEIYDIGCHIDDDEDARDDNDIYGMGVTLTANWQPAAPHAYLGRHQCFLCQPLTTHACRYNRLPIKMETMMLKIIMKMMIKMMKFLLPSAVLAVTRLSVAKW